MSRAAALAAAALAGVCGCKTDDAPRPAPAAPAAAPPRRVDAPPAAPSAPDAAAPLTLARVQALAPTLPGAAELAPPRLLASGQARQTWCVPGADAAAVAADLARALAQAGWDDVTHRGDGDRAGASGTQDGLVISVAIGGRDAACPGGVVASAHYRGATVTVPGLDVGTSIR